MKLGQWRAFTRQAEAQSVYNMSTFWAVADMPKANMDIRAIVLKMRMTMGGGGGGGGGWWGRVVGGGGGGDDFP